MTFNEAHRSDAATFLSCANVPRVVACGCKEVVRLTGGVADALADALQRAAAVAFKLAVKRGVWPALRTFRYRFCAV